MDVVVLEKHADFLRDFRGDTIHPSTLEVMHELGLLDEFLKRPHQEARQLTRRTSATSRSPSPTSPTCRRAAGSSPSCRSGTSSTSSPSTPGATRRSACGCGPRSTDLIEEDGRVVGVRATTPDGPLEVRAELTVGADGRHSTVRDAGRAGGRGPRRADRRALDAALAPARATRDQPLGRFDRGRIFVMLYRGDYWQCGFVIPKGGFDEIRRRGLEAFREDIASDRAVPRATGSASCDDWDDDQAADRRRRPAAAVVPPGLLCIGDAAHAMSPVGGVGINLAIQDAVAAANLLAEPLRRRARPPSRTCSLSSGGANCRRG